MQSNKCIFSAPAVLRRIFILPVENAIPRYVRQASRRNLSLQPHRPLIPKPFAIQCGSFKTKAERHPMDYEIQNRKVYIIDTDGVYHPESRRTHDVLENLKQGQHLCCVEEPPEDWQLPAKCRIFTRQQLLRIEEQKWKIEVEARKKTPSKIVKVLELNWSIDNNDLAHRLVKVREFLGKGNRLSITISPKKRGKVADREQAEELLRKLRQVVQEGDGARLGWKEYQAMEGEILKTVKLNFEGKMDAQAQAAERERIKGEEEEARAEEKENTLDWGKPVTLAKLAKREKWKRKQEQKENESWQTPVGW